MSDTKFYPDDELVALVRTLDRAEDAHAFAEDVTQTHPSLATEYRRICPRRADLALCEQRARSGAYGYDAKLKPLRADIALMVSNCVRFNGKEHPLAAVAQGFEHFANAELNNYIASKTGGRRISSLRLQSSGNASLPSEDSNKNSNSAHDGNDRNNKCDESGYGLAAYSHPEASSVSTPTIAELVDLVQLLARREDAGAFEVNVAEAYPELRVAYELACPQQMNLTMMRARAESGYYLQSNTEDAETTTAATRATTAAESALTHSLPEADIDSKDDSESIPPPKQHDSNTAAHSANSNDDDAHHHDTHTRNDNKASEGAQTCTTMHSDTSTTDTSTATNRDHAVGTDDLPSETKTEKAVLRAPVFGHCTADSLPRMRADVELIVRNCVTFNARVEAWVKLARSFQRFAHRKLDDFVIRHAPHLHGSLSGVEKYAQSTSSSISATTGGNVLFNTTGAAAAAPGGVKRRRTSDAGRVPVHPALHTRRFDAAVVAAGMTPSQTYNNKNNDNSGYANNEFAADVDDGIGTNVASYHNEAISCNRPDVCENNSRDAEQDEALTVNPTPLQPPLSIAASLRVRLLRDHVQREHVALRRIGQSVLVRECMMGVTTDREATVKDATSEPHHEERTKEQSQPRDREKEEEHDVSCLQSHHAHAVEREATATATTAADCENDEIAKLPSDAKVLLTSDYAVDTVLDRFVESVRQFYHRQRSRPDFHSVFDFDVHEEQMYVDWARIVREQFNRLVQVLLLYPREAAEASSLVAEYTLCQGEKRLQQQLQAQHEHTDNNKNNTHDSNKQHSGACEKSETERAAVGGTCWSAHLHVSYLVRFLVQLPQIASLCCATASQGMPPQHHSPLPAGGSALAAHDAVVLCISKDALAMLKRVTKITSECLQFIADYENCLAQQIASSALSP